MPLISVIVPVYKVEAYLARCIDSILEQSFRDFELILVDDGSPDNCGAICEEYAIKDSRIHVIHRENGGLSAARNTGIDWAFANSNSEWLSYIDSDDWIHPQFLELLYEAVNKYKVNIAQCIFYETDGSKPLPSVGTEMCSMTPDEEYMNYYNAHAWGKIYHKRCFETLRYPDGKIFEDVAIWYKLLFAEKQIAVIKEPLYYYYFRNDSIVNRSWTPSNLNQVDAWDEQMSFLESYGNEQVYQEAVGRFLWVLSIQLKGAKSSNSINKDDKRHYVKVIRKKIGKLLKNNRNLIKDRQKYLWYFEMAHPRLAQYYWAVKRVTRKKKRI